MDALAEAELDDAEDLQEQDEGLSLWMEDNCVHPNGVSEAVATHKCPWVWS